HLAVGGPVERVPPGRVVERRDELEVERVRVRARREVLARRAQDAGAGAGRAHRRRKGRLLVALQRADLERRGGAAERRGGRPPERDRDVPLAVRLVDRGARRELETGLEAPEDVPGVRVEGAEDAVAAAREPEAARGRRDATAARLRRDDAPGDAAE